VAVRCTSLRHLYLARCAITDRALEALGDFTLELRELHVAGCAGITDAGVASLAAGCRHLTALSVDTVAGISDEGARALAGCAELTSFQANGCSGLGCQGLIALAAGCKALKRIDVRGYGDNLCSCLC
jgi:hypothetical protein